jgi:hypothetical protein
MKTLSKTTENFLRNSFIGNGKYYTTQAGSKHYNNSPFQNFANNNSECFKIVENGNDAPRGGKTGDFVIVEFNDKFYSKYQFFFDALNAEKQAKEDFKNSAIRSRETMVNYINENKAEVLTVISELNELKNLLTNKMKFLIWKCI